MVAKRRTVEEQLERQDKFNTEFSQRVFKLQQDVKKLQTALQTPEPAAQAAEAATGIGRLEDMTVPQLRKVASEKGVVGVDDMTRAMLMHSIRGKRPDLAEGENSKAD